MKCEGTKRQIYKKKTISGTKFQKKKGVKNHLFSSIFAIAVLPLMMQWCRGVWPIESEAFMSAPYCRSSSTIPMSAAWHARWSSEQPSWHPSMDWSSVVLGLSEELEDALPKELSTKKSNLLSTLTCSCNFITSARVKNVLDDAFPWIALTSTSELTILR